ncbi:uncharacterized protein K02A2.6-like, partial [Crotalus tigris]|uniref:uncharacterized protein K02A2.6-like n=1 Tax=Crotalus tigris TaxID=88082 RepID=UPI00192F3DA1
LDTGSAFSIISLHTFRKICSGSGTQAKLRPSDIVLTDFQNSRVCVKGEATLNVQYKSFEGPLDLLVVGGERTSLIGLDWFEALGIHVTGLNSLQTLDLQEVCKEFADVFSPQLGTFKGPPVSLKLDPTVTPIRIKARRVPFALKSKIDTELDKLIQQGILEPVDSSPWETPIVTPLKANGDIRICADYKCTLNKALQQHAYPVPVVSHILASLKGGRVFAKLDLAQAYQQLPVDDDAAIAQTIVTHRGAFKVKRLQFGVNVAPGIFQSVMENTLRGIPGVCPYFDDVLIAGDSTHILAERLRAVLLRFRKSGLKLKKDKCMIGVPSTEFLGFKIDAAGIHPAESKLTAILEAPRPKSKAELQAFLGLLNFYNSFLPQKASVAEPLHRLLDKQAVWQWSQMHEGCFNKVKALLTSNSVLAHFNESLPVCITCDASPYEVGAVLSHLRSDGTQVPVAYYSRTLSSAERNYAQIDREALAVVAGIKKFHDFLYGRHFTVFTDHKPLLGLFTTRKQTPQIISPRMLRWSIFLSAYDFSLLHKPGKEMGHADGLSRLPLPVVEADPAPAVNILSIQALPELPLSARDVAAESGTDHTLSRVRSWVLSGWPEHCPSPEFQSFWSKRNELSLSQGCLLWGNRVVIPTSMRTRVLESLHEGHPGIVRMKALARSHLWWPGLDKDIEAKVHACHLCQRSRPEMPQAPVHRWKETQFPWSRVHIDYAGPFQGQFFLVLVDSHSKWLEVVPVSSTTTAKTIQVLRGIFAAHGLPDVIVSDNGPQFTSSEFQAFLQANFLLSYRTTPSTSTGRSPAELRWGRQLTTKLDRLHPDRLPSSTSHPRAPRQLLVGAPVWARNYGPGHTWVPASISRVTGPLSYKVALDNGRVLRRHIDQFRPRRAFSDETPGMLKKNNSVRDHKVAILIDEVAEETDEWNDDNGHYKGIP